MALLDYTILVTGDCQNTSSGILELFPVDGAGPYTVDWYNPNLGVDTTVTTSSVRTGLSAGTYQVMITDTTTPTNQVLYVNLYVSSGVCLSTDSVNTTCSYDNGYLIVTATTDYSPVSYYLYSLNHGYITSASTLVGFQIFNNLSADTYYVEAFDDGGCSGSTATCLIQDSIEFDFGIFVINDSNCSGIDNGKLYVTGQTVGSPYTYLWSNGETTSTITGLTAGTYSVTVTNSLGCIKTKTATVVNVDSLNIVTYLLTNPNCFSSDGEITPIITGGTPPYYYQLSNGDTQITYSTSPTFTGLSSGIYTVTVTDAGLCVTSGGTSLSTLDSFNIIGVTVTPSFCSASNGSIGVNVQGGNTPYTYSLTGSLGYVLVSATTSTSVVFNNLVSDTYHLIVSNQSNCQYETDLVINNQDKFTINYSSNNTTCGLDNGQITLSVSTGGTYTYEVAGYVQTTTLTSVTYNNIASGIYNATVTDQTGCKQSAIISVGDSNSVQFSLINSGCGTGSDGTITAAITNGTQPFTLEWSPNVGAQSGIFVTGLTAGTYSLKVTDSNGCTLTKQTTIDCLGNYKTYSIFNICDDKFVDTQSTKTGISQMFNQGYQDLIQGDINCKLTSADFILLVNVGGTAYTSNFYTSTSLTDYPTDQQYVDSLNAILETIPGIGAIIISLIDNSIVLNTDCSYSLSDINLSVNLLIDYNICCMDFPQCILLYYDLINGTPIQPQLPPILPSVTPIIFTSGSTINGYNSWVGSVSGNPVTLYYNTTNSRWETSGFTNFSFIESFQYFSPIGNWVNMGNPNYYLVTQEGSGLDCLESNLQLRFNSDNFSSQNIYIEGTGNFDIRINWGDGTTNDYIGNSAYNFSRTYSQPGVYTATVTLSDSTIVTDLEINNSNLITISGIETLVNLNSLYLNNNQLTLFDPESSLPNSLVIISLSDNQIAMFNPTLPLPISLQFLNLSYNQITMFNPTLPLPDSISYLGLGDNQITMFDPTLPLPNSLLYLFLNGNQITSFDPTLPLPTSLFFLKLNDNLLTSFDPTLSLPNSLGELYLNGNQITSFDPTLPLPNSLFYLSLSDNQLTFFDPLINPLPFLIYLYLTNNLLNDFEPINYSLPNTIKVLYLNNNKLPSTGITNTIIYLNNVSWADPTSSTCFLYSQTTGGCFNNTGAGNIAYDSLISQGWGINVDFC
jgi:hypothetical protein